MEISFTQKVENHSKQVNPISVIESGAGATEQITQKRVHFCSIFKVCPQIGAKMSN